MVLCCRYSRRRGAWMDHQWGNFRHWRCRRLGLVQPATRRSEQATCCTSSAVQTETRRRSTGLGWSRGGWDDEVGPSSRHRFRTRNDWTSPNTGGVYPSAWVCKQNGPSSVRWRSRPKLADQTPTFQGLRNSATNPPFPSTGKVLCRPAPARLQWCTSAEGYVELTGFADSPITRTPPIG